MSAANGYVILAADGTGAQQGELVEFQFFDASIGRL
jgi:molybdopterin biosynthesis enzyme